MVLRFALIVAVLAALSCAIDAQVASESPASAKPGVRLELTVPPASPVVRRYNDTTYALYFTNVAWSLLGLLVFIRLRFNLRLRDALQQRFRRPMVRAALFFAGLALWTAIWALPLGFIGYLTERNYGFATLGPGMWLTDRLKHYVIGLIEAPLVAAAYWLIAIRPKMWWLHVWFVLLPFMFVGAMVYPVLIDPMFNRFTPLAEGKLRTRIELLAAQAGVRGATIEVADKSKRTTRLNAYVTGLGPTRRIVIWDTTLATLSEDEIVAIVGHEMGHYVLRHVWWGLVAGAVMALVLLRVLDVMVRRLLRRYPHIRGPFDLASMPVAFFAIAILLFVQQPIAASFSRAQERQADAFGLRVTGLNKATAAAFIRFVDRDFADPDPPAFIVWWMYSHPPIRERIASALNGSPESQ